MNIRNQITLIAVGLLASLSMLGQSGATISGVVKDQKGQPLGSVEIESVSKKTAEKRTATTGADGTFSLLQLQPDTYQITARTADGGDASSILDVGAGQTRSVEMVINTQSTATTIELDTAGTTLEQTSARLSANISTTETAGLPVNGRTFGPLMLQAPLVSTTGGASLNELHFAGQSSNQNRYRLDGIDASSVVTAYPGFLPSPGNQFRLSLSTESIQEFRIDSTLYPSNGGGGSGAQVGLLSKSGTASWHGSVFEYFRHDKLQTRDFFDGAEKDHLRMNQYGAAAGGALVKDKLFAFGSFEALKQGVGSAYFAQVPSALLLDKAASELSPILKALPVASAATADPDLGISVRNLIARQNETTINTRLDYLASEKHRFFARYSRATGTMSTPDNSATGRVLDGATRSDSMVASWSASLTNNLTSQLTVGLVRTPSLVAAVAENPSLNEIRVLVGSMFDTSNASPGGMITLFNGSFGSRAEYRGRSYNVNEALGWIKGKHTLQAGAEYRGIRSPFQIRGGTLYNYREWDSFATNTDADITYSPDMPFLKPAQANAAFFVGDEWRLRPELLLNVSLRYEWTGATSELGNHATLLNPFSFTRTAANGGFWTSSKTGFQPRVALAWSPKRLTGKTVLRIGAGMYQAPYAFLDTLLPIQATAPTYFFRGGAFPMSGAEIASNPESIRKEFALDASSFGKISRVYSFSGSIQQALPGKYILEVGYAGNLARHLTQTGVSNLGIGVNPQSGDEIRPVAGYGAVRYLTNGGNSSYNALRLAVNRKFVDNLTLAGSYNWAHAIGTTDGAGDSYAPQNPNCLSCERASSGFDARQTISVNAVYDLPFGKNQRHFSTGVPAKVLGGWSTAASWNARTGLPVNVLISRADELYYSPSTKQYYSPSANFPTDSYAVPNTPGGGEDRGVLRPDLVSGVPLYLHNGGTSYLNPAAFATPMPGTFGNLGRNALRGPGFTQVDLQVTRAFRVTEQARIYFRADAFNLLNHSNFANPSSVLPDTVLDAAPGTHYTAATAGNFGTLPSVLGRTVGLGTSRQLQLGLRFEF